MCRPILMAAIRFINPGKVAATGKLRPYLHGKVPIATGSQLQRFAAL
jgi:hypothetical protein